MSNTKPTYEMLEQKIELLEKEIKENKSFLNMLFNAIPNPIFYKDRDGIYKHVNESFSKTILGISKDEITNKSLYDLPNVIPTELADIYKTKDSELFENPGVQNYEAKVMCSDDIVRYYNFYKATHSENDEVVGLVGVMLDISEQKKVIEELDAKNRLLSKLSNKDTLTKLYNRRYLYEIIKNLFPLAKREKSPISMLMLDIDKFKEVNDIYGHKVGDNVLVLLSSTLQDKCRESDIVCRWGGEEFLILLPHTDSVGAYKRAEKLRNIIEKIRIDVDEGAELSFTVSIGVSQVVLDEENCFEIAIKGADDALYKAKNSGRNRVCIQ